MGKSYSLLVFIPLQAQKVGSSYSMQMASENRRMSEPCKSTSEPVVSPQPPRSQSAALPPHQDPNLNSGLVDNMDTDNTENKFNIPDDIMQFINFVCIFQFIYSLLI